MGNRFSAEISPKPKISSECQDAEVMPRYVRLRQFEKSIEYYQKVQEMAVRQGDKKLEAVANLALRLAYTGTRQYQTAIKHYQKAQEIAVQQGDQRQEAAANLGLRNAYRYSVVSRSGMKNHEAAISGIQEARTVNGGLDDQGSPKQVEWTPSSKTHQNKFEKLRECIQNGEKVQEINGVRVYCKPEFQIGKGSEGTTVYIGLGKDGIERAVKRIPKTSVVGSDSTEKKVMTTANVVTSNHLLKYYSYDNTSNEDFAYLIMDLCEESLKEFVERQSAEELTTHARDIIRQILQGLKDLHQPQPNQILHRDVKPSNILRDVYDRWLLADFGISRVLPEDETSYHSGQRGTKYWTAVESFHNAKDVKSNCSQVRYKKQSDIQVAGMVCFYILTNGNHPFGDEADRQRNLLDDKPVGLGQLTDPTAEDLIGWMLQHKPDDRPSAEEALKHPYVQSPDLQFELIVSVGNLPDIKTKLSTCNVVQKLNGSTDSWKTKLLPGVLAYLCSHGIRPKKYGDEWTECLRLIRNVAIHWNDRVCPRPKVHYDVGEPKEYFLRTFPDLPVRVHRIIRSCPDWNKRPELEKFF